MMKIGVWNTAFLGDAILTLPLLQTLRAVFPDVGIDFWVRKGFGELFAAHPAVNNVYEYDKRGRDRGALHTLRFLRSLRRGQYGLWLSAHGSFRSGMAALWSGASMRIGYAEPRINAVFYTRTVPRRFADFGEIERLLRLLEPLTRTPYDTPRCDWPDIVVSQRATDAAERLFTSFAAPKNVPVLGMHPGSIWGTKRWPPEYFATIAAKAVREGARVFVFGGPGAEEATAGKTVSLALDGLLPEDGKRIVNLAGTLSLPELAAVIRRLSCYLTNDSGPMHLAWSQRTPVTALFGPTTRELGFFPRGEGATVMELPLPCRPCGLHGPQTCPLGHHECMRGMTPETVWPDVAAKLFATAARA